MGGDIGGILSAFSNPFIAKKTTEAQIKSQEDLMERQFEMIQEMFPGITPVSQLMADLYGGQGGTDVSRYLRDPIPMLRGEAALAGFLGSYAPVHADKIAGLMGIRTGPGGQGEPIDIGGPLSGFFGQGPEMLQDYISGVEGMFPAARDLYETGFRTDIQPALDYANWYLTDQAIPTQAERFGGDLFGTGHQQAQINASRQLAAELGLQQIALDEAAAGRRVQGLPLAANLFSLPLKAGTEYMTLASQAASNLRQQAEQARPGFRLLGALPTFANAVSRQGFIQQGFPTSGTDTGDLFSALGQAVPGLLSNLGGMFGGGGAGGAGSIYSDPYGGSQYLQQRGWTPNYGAGVYETPPLIQSSDQPIPVTGFGG